ncbi:MAG: hypothetical protein MUF10_19775, partial [Thermoanaerobaculaceae bacterium]|nr:hypothetical protein [Thermoanaerobaculaceae bacterium]
YFVIPYTLAAYLASTTQAAVSPVQAEFREAEAEVETRVKRLLGAKGSRSVDACYRELGKVMFEACGMSRTADGLRAAIDTIRGLREAYWKDVRVPGEAADLNQELEKAGRVADFFELAELMCLDALTREESCGGHFREEHQMADGEARRDDEGFCHVTVWEHAGDGAPPVEHREPLEFESVKLATRSYK